MKTLSTFISFFAFISISIAQWNPTANLTVFSDDGSAFYLILNGEKYNETPQTNIRVEELPNPYYSCKIIFAESTKATISKNIQLTDANGIPQDVTYIIKAQTPSKYVLRYYSAIPAEQNMMRPTTASVYRFGAPNVMVAGPGYAPQTTVIQTAPPMPATQTTQQVTTTTTQTVPGNVGVNVNQGGINVNMGGLGLNMNVNLPVDGATTTTTTTTTTVNDGYTQQTQYNSNTTYQQPQQNHHQHNNYNGGGCMYAMNPQDFSAAQSTISGISFSDTQLSTAKSIASSNCLSTDQIGTLMSLFSFEETKLDFAKYAYDYCVDRNNYFKIVNKFTFDASKTELNQYISGRH